MYEFSDNEPYSNKRLNINIYRSNLKLKLSYEHRMQVLNKQLEQIMYHSRNQEK